MSLRLQEAFGLRREESIKIRPGWADEGNAIRLKASWTKGGRDRELPIRTEAQRVVLDEAKKLAAGRSLIPQGSTYKEQLNAYKAECQRVGLNGNHGLRHRYAQTRYFEKTGWQCPARGGPTKKQLTPGAALDRPARAPRDLARARARARAGDCDLPRTMTAMAMSAHEKAAATAQPEGKPAAAISRCHSRQRGA